MTWLGLGLWGWMAAALGAPPPAHAVVIADPLDGAEGARIAAAVGDLLEGSGRTMLLAHRFLQGRVQEEPPALFRRCAGDVGCWREAGLRAGVDQVVLVERVDTGVLGVRVVDVGTTGGFRMDKADLVAGGPDPDLVDRLFFRVGRLELTGLPHGATVRIDGGSPRRVDGILSVEVPGGKHTLEIQAADHAPVFATCLVRPDETTWVSLDLTPTRNGRRRITRWTTWVAAGLIAGGAAALGLTADARGVALAAE